jgi:hypothetical protein
LLNRLHPLISSLSEPALLILGWATHHCPRTDPTIYLQEIPTNFLAAIQKAWAGPREISRLTAPPTPLPPKPYDRPATIRFSSLVSYESICCIIPQRDISVGILIVFHTNGERRFPLAVTMSSPLHELLSIFPFFSSSRAVVRNSPQKLGFSWLEDLELVAYYILSGFHVPHPTSNA